MPRLASGRVAVDIYGQRSDFRQEPFYGIGQDSDRDDETFYALGNTGVGGGVTVTRRGRGCCSAAPSSSWQPDVRGIDDDMSIEDVFTAEPKRRVSARQPNFSATPPPRR